MRSDNGPATIVANDRDWIATSNHEPQFPRIDALRKDGATMRTRRLIRLTALASIIALAVGCTADTEHSGATGFGGPSPQCDNRLRSAIITQEPHDQGTGQLLIRQIQKTTGDRCRPNTWAPEIAEYQACGQATTNPEIPLRIRHFDLPQSLTRKMLTDGEGGHITGPARQHHGGFLRRRTHAKNRPLLDVHGPSGHLDPLSRSTRNGLRGTGTTGSG